MKFKVNDLLVNRHTHRKAIVDSIEADWPIPIYVLEYQDGNGGQLRINMRYEKHWEKVE
tara:strand:- start:9415 stop:9591 length:177 start_codon:yes stop_codon:yes gene_type:complete